jgi:hypothetical protein
MISTCWWKSNGNTFVTYTKYLSPQIDQNIATISKIGGGQMRNKSLIMSTRKYHMKI